MVAWGNGQGNISKTRRIGPILRVSMRARMDPELRLAFVGRIRMIVGGWVDASHNVEIRYRAIG